MAARGHRGATTRRSPGSAASTSRAGGGAALARRRTPPARRGEGGRRRSAGGRRPRRCGSPPVRAPRTGGSGRSPRSHGRRRARSRHDHALQTGGAAARAARRPAGGGPGLSRSRIEMMPFSSSPTTTGCAGSRARPAVATPGRWAVRVDALGLGHHPVADRGRLRPPPAAVARSRSRSVTIPTWWLRSTTTAEPTR